MLGLLLINVCLVVLAFASLDVRDFLKRIAAASERIAAFVVVERPAHDKSADRGAEAVRAKEGGGGWGGASAPQQHQRHQ